jgi:hypothetical protein
MSRVEIKAGTNSRNATLQNSRPANESNVLLGSPRVEIPSCEGTGHHRRELIWSAGEQRTSEACKCFGVLGLISWMAGIRECKQND